MSETKLTSGKPRLGWLIDGNPNTPDIAVMLQRADDHIVLSVPMPGMTARNGSPYDRWFFPGAGFDDGPDGQRYTNGPPRVLMFEDHQGPVVLVGCRASGSSTNLSAGIGLIVANFAVLGGRNLRYDTINGMRSELPGLATWSGQRSVETNSHTDNEGRVQKIDVHLGAPPEIPLARKMNLTFRPTWRTSYPDNIGTFAAHDIVELSTASRRPRDWGYHLEGHIALRELLVLSAWRHFGFNRLSVNREDDPISLLAGQAVEQRWADVVTHRLPIHEDWAQDPRFLFMFQDIGPAGVKRWLSLRSRFARAMQPLIGIADQPSASLESRLVQSGISLEALGYQIELDRGGDNFDRRGQLIYMKALEDILNESPMVPVSDAEDWKRRSRDCYMRLKHPDGRLPDSLTLANTLRENLLVMRVWLAAKLGCPTKVLESRINSDPLSNEYIWIG